jgi:hypothetical protein
MADSAAFNQWAADIRAVSREQYDATPEQMYGRYAKKLGQSIKQFYRDWHGYSRRLTPPQALAEIITDIEQKLDTGVGTLDRGESS